MNCSMLDCSLLNNKLGVVPINWKHANITAVFKKDDPSLSCNYRPISLLCVLSKVLERCVHSHSYYHLAPLIYKMQHGFMRGKSTTTQLLEVYHDILEHVASGKEVDAIFLDLSKAFDKVPHNLLVKKLENSGIGGPLLAWFRSYLTDQQQCVVLHGVCSDWLPVTSGVPQGSILGPLLFLIYCNDVQNYIQAKSTLTLFADDSKLYRSLDLPNASTSLQHNLDSLQIWSVDMKIDLTRQNAVMHFSKKKLKTETSYILTGQQLEQVTHISDLGITVSSDLSWFKHIENIAAKANKTLGLIKRISKQGHN